MTNVETTRAENGSQSNSDMRRGIHCMVCDNRDRTLFETRFRKPDCEIVECMVCSFHFIPPAFRRTVDYTQYKPPEVALEMAKGDIWMKIQRNLLRFRMIRKYEKDGKIYDVGCGFGHFLLTGKQIGYSVAGVEMCKANVEFVRDNIGIDVDEGDFLSVQEDVQYDIVTMWDVLEHLDDGDQIAAKIARMLRPGGYVFIQVPQIDSFFARLCGDRWWAMGLDHVNYFSKRTVRRFLGKHGLDVKRFHSSVELKNVYSYMILPRLKRKKNATGGLTATERQREYNKLTSKPLWVRRLIVVIHNIIYWFLSSLRLGDEMIVVAQKRSRV